jgi:hypothetical protein
LDQGDSSWGHLKILFSRTTGPILTRLGTNHPWRERIQVSLKEVDSPSPRGDNSERVKIHIIFFFNFLLQNQHTKVNQGWGHLKILFLRTMKPEKLNFT